MSSFADRLYFFRKRENLTLKELGKKSGFDYRYISRLEKGLHLNPPYDTVKKLAEAVNVSASVLFEGKEYNALTVEGLQKLVPVLAWNQIEDWLEQGESMQREKAFTYVGVSISRKDSCFLLQINNNAMQSQQGETYNEGDFVVVEPARDADSGKIIICKRKNDSEPILRKLVKEGGHIKLVPLNSIYETETITDIDDVTILGIVIERRVPVL